MDQQACDILYSGALVAGRDPVQVKADLAKLFKTDAAGIERLFCGQPVIIKKGVDPQTAEKYRVALEKAGAVCEIRVHMPADAIPPVASVPRSVSSQDRITIAPAGTLLTAPKDIKRLIFDLGSISLAEAGIVILEGPETVVVAPLFDLSGLSVAPPGGELVEVRRVELLPFPDFNGLSVAAAGVDIDTRVRVTSAVMPGIDGISLAPAGTEVLRPDEVKPRPLPPDLTKLKLSLETP